MKARSTLGFLVAGTLAVGCGGGDGGGGGGGGGSVTIDELPAGFAGAMCAALDECMGALVDVFLGGNDCVTQFQNGFEDAAFQNLKDAIDAGRVVYDPAKAGDCIDAIEALGCGALGNQLPDVCEEALAGTVAEGGDCGLDQECVGDAFCDRAGDACPGTCTARSAAGAECGSDDHCQSGLVCGDSSRCVEPAGPGETCEGASAPDCEVGLLCIGSDGDTPGTCRGIDEVLVGDAGDACDFESGMLCREGLSCVVQGFTPGVGPELTCAAEVGAGAACRVGVPDQCPAGQYCAGTDLMTLMFEGTCAPLPGDGEPCAGGLLGAGCAGGHACIEDTCRLIQRNGGSCTDDGQCYSGNCEGGACVPDAACVP